MNYTSEQLLEKAQTDGLIRFTGEGKSERIVYVYGNNPPERWSDPEEKVRADYYLQLIYLYEYAKERIEIEYLVPRRTPNDRADIVVFEDDERTKPYIVVECKKDGVSQAEFLQAIEQAVGNRASLNARFAVTVSGGTQHFLDFKGYGAQEREKNQVSDIPIKYGNPPEWRFFKNEPGKDLSAVSREELRSAIRKCHQTLWEGGRRSAIVAFGEFSKIIFVKIRDEMNPHRITGAPYAFQIRTQETKEALAKRILDLYDTEKVKEPDVFTDTINVDPAILHQVVEHIQRISFSKTDLDTKGVAFEEFMGGFFKGDFGQYFTPRELIAFSVHMIPPSVEDFILDPACGSGGFLLFPLDYIRKEADKLFPNHKTNVQESKDHFKYWHDFAEKHLYGIEINDELARVAKMNMIVHDDGHTNIVGSDALDFMANLTAKKEKLQADTFSLVYTNPPFGSVVKKAEKGANFLEQYSLLPYLNKSTSNKDIDDSAASESDAKRGAKAVKIRASVKTEILFLERVYNFLKPGTGRAAIVVPDGILTNSSLQGVRDWLMERFQILAVVSLPQFAFSHYDAGVKASVLFLRKRGENETPSDDEAIFMAQAENIGYDATGRKTFKITVESETPESEKVEIHSCDLFDYRVYYEWNRSDPKRQNWSEKYREVIPNTGIVAQFHQFQRDPTPFFV